MPWFKNAIRWVVRGSVNVVSIKKYVAGLWHVEFDRNKRCIIANTAAILDRGHMEREALDLFGVCLGGPEEQEAWVEFVKGKGLELPPQGVRR